MAETTRVQQVDGKTVLETTSTDIVKKQVTEARLLAQKIYFVSMIAKGQAGLAKVEAQLTTIQNAKTGTA